MKVNEIVIVGGGSAGWMTAATLAFNFPEKTITVVESPDIPTVGVGESTIESISRWLYSLGISDEDFMKHTDASYKLSIKFTDFYKKGFGSFHYPFGSIHDQGLALRTRDWYVRKIFDSTIPSSDYALTHYPQMYMSELGKFSKNEDNKLPTYSFPQNVAFHFDAAKFGSWLRDTYCAKFRNLTSIKSTVKDAEVSDAGIEILVLENGDKLQADLFIDCTGFKSILLSGYLKEPFESFEDILPNDSAVATRIPYKDKERELMPYTECTAIANGWVWNIPLWSRVGTGYVYSSKFISDDQAVQEFSEYLNIPSSELDVKIIKMRTGIQKKVWSKNVCAIGLSAAFIEPLESTGLYSVHEFLTALVDSLQRPEVTQWDKDVFNYNVKTQFRQLFEFVLMHYALSQRDDTEYWKTATSRTYFDGFYTLEHDQLSKYGGGVFELAYDSIFDWQLRDRGIQSIAVGMQYLPLTKQRVFSLGFNNNVNVSDFLKPFWAKRDEEKAEWKLYAESQPSHYKYLKEHIYND